MTAPPERTIFCPRCRRTCWITRQVVADGEMVPVEYYCPVHGTVAVEYHRRGRGTKSRA